MALSHLQHFTYGPWTVKNRIGTQWPQTVLQQPFGVSYNLRLGLLLLITDYSMVK